MPPKVLKSSPTPYLHPKSLHVGLSDLLPLTLSLLLILSHVHSQDKQLSFYSSLLHMLFPLLRTLFPFLFRYPFRFLKL